MAHSRRGIMQPVFGENVAVSQTHLTLAQFMALPEEEPPLEFVDGSVSRKVSPNGRHSALQMELAERVNRSARPHAVARAFPELRVTFGGASRVPDIAIYRWERIPRDESGKIADDFSQHPDITVEIASPEHNVTALVRRCLWYVSNGVQMALLVDPADESVLAFREGGEVSALHGTDRIDLSDVLPEFELTVDELFDALR